MQQDELKKMMEYDADTGIFTWIKPAYNKPQWKGKQVGSLEPNGYLGVIIEGTRYRMHRLAWLYMTGKWPNAEIDHINLNRSDNRWVNLREVTKSQQQQNGPLLMSNTSGHKGVSWSVSSGKWRAYIVKDGKQKHLGLFSSREEAASAYREAAERLFGEFARPI